MPPFRTREVVLPRFKLEQSYDLIENLKEMGLTDLFQESGDFSGMTSEKVVMNWVSKTKSVIILLTNDQTDTKGKHQNKIKVCCWSFSHLDALSTAINNPYKLFQNNGSLLIPLPSWSTREPSLWMKRGQRLLLWPRWASCPSPLRSASLWTSLSSSSSTSTAQTALCSWAGWSILHRAKLDQKAFLNS